MCSCETREAARRSGSGQTSAGAARCTRGMRSRMDRPGPARVTRPVGRAPAGARAADLRSLTPSGASPPFRRGCASATSGVGGDSGRGTTSRRRTCVRDRPVPGRAPPGDGQARPGDPIRRGAVLATAGCPGRAFRPCTWVAARLARSHASKERAIGSVWGVGKVLQSPRTSDGSRRRCWPGHGISRGSSYRGARCPLDHRTWRAADALWVC